MALTDDLISFWPLNEASGNALDSHGSFPLTETSGTIGSAAGLLGNARDLEAGDSEWFAHADAPELSSGTRNFTIAGWLKAESWGGNPAVFSKGWGDPLGNPNWEHLLYHSGTFLEWIIFFNGSLMSRTASDFGSPPTDQWMFVAVGSDVTNGVIWISINAGTAQETSNVFGEVNDGASDFVLGAAPFASLYFDGLMQQWGYWNRRLTPSELTTLVNGGAGRAYPWSSGGASLFGSSALVGRSVLVGRSALVTPGGYLR